MRFLFAIFTLVLIEAKRKRPVDPSMVDEYAHQGPNVFGNPDNYKWPIPFGRLPKEGAFDPHSDLKTPLDGLDFYMVRPRTREEAEKVWKTRRNEIQIIINERTQRLTTPRNIYLDYDENAEVSKDRNETRPWIDWEANLRANILKQHGSNFKPQQTKPNPPTIQTEGYDTGPKSGYFAPVSFDLVSNIRENTINWTTCDEFGKSPDFHPKDIVDIDWVPFYVWATHANHQVSVYRFSFLTKKVVKEYKDVYANNLNKTIDWEQPKLILKEITEMLLIAGDRAGLFHAIPHQELPDFVKNNKNIIYPSLTIRMKVKDPYLAIMYCELQFTAIMAVAGSEPNTYKDKVSEAGVLKIRGSGYPVFRDLESERMQSEAERRWIEETKDRGIIKVNPDLNQYRDHFLGRYMK